MLLRGADKVKLLFRGLSEICLSCWLIFAVYIFTEEEINNLETVVSMLSCGALEKSNNGYIESLVEPCVPKNQE